MASSPMKTAAAPASRLAWIDWMRGLACILMFQTHCYDAWLGGDARKGAFLEGSQRLGTLPAPSFLFLAGISFALVVDKLVRKETTAAAITRTMARRGAEILVFGLLFRLQEFVIAWGWAPKSDLLRVDVLNIIGLSMILMALLCGLVLAIFRNQRWRSRLIAASLLVTAGIALVTPLLYTSWRPSFLPWWLESYVNGCHNLGTPQSYLFPFFPWGAFAFSGLATGLILFSDQARNKTAKTLAILSAIGAAAILLAWGFDHSSVHLYAIYDYWHTSPNFLMMRVGMLLMIAFLSFAWCRWGLATKGFSPLIQLGQTSLLVYWVHIEFVYGRFSILPRRSVSILTASRGLIEITIFMLILSLIRTRIDWKKLSLREFTRKLQPA